MRAVGYKHSLPIENADSLLDIAIAGPRRRAATCRSP